MSLTHLASFIDQFQKLIFGAFLLSHMSATMILLGLPETQSHFVLQW